MFGSRYLPSDRTRWTDGFDSSPVWPSEPDLAVSKDVVAAALHVQVQDLSVEFLAEGTHHKVYEISSALWSTFYIFRIAIPIFPFYKMESEMATLTFLRQNTQIPVAKPIAWDSSAKGPLGYEWASVEKLPGVELRHLWNQAPWDKKLDIIDVIAAFLAQLWDPRNRFSKIGSLYLKEPHHGRDPHHPASSPTKATGNERFLVGAAVDGDLFAGRRRYIPEDRGPYDSCHHWLGSLIQAEERFLRSAGYLLAYGKARNVNQVEEEWEDMLDEIGFEEENFEEKQKSTLRTCRDYRFMLHRIFPQPNLSQKDEPRFYLHHCDLREANIILDPETFAITGVIDWEQSCILPDWYAIDYPLFINDDEPINNTEPPIPKTYDVDSNEYSETEAAERTRWEAKALRRRFDCNIECLLKRNDWRPTSSPQNYLKSRFIQGIANLSES
ncbi:hypothetical protein QQS21_007309 [Conoideocrella luteorostrata]|uniref:Aminoglycoside phosphotransferase domain-containing protein n=1 Tax=Conoideocrella luteorostrata TaxID=1105319 RepID=A0AAJ0CQ95_9HYPO|nr:hypothetical protein QQS21_007309 [Conoideocrella luteorostrata]